MTRTRRRATREQPPEFESLENAWKLHDLQMDWTGKVDAKAVFALTIQAALLAIVAGVLDEMKTALEWMLLILSIGLVATGAVFAALVVRPRLRAKNLVRESGSSFIYFGHARHLTGPQLAERLRTVDLTEQVSLQVVRMAEIAWIKHKRVAVSIWLGLAGGAFLLAAVAVARISSG